jgi:hypothetical protein
MKMEFILWLTLLAAITIASRRHRRSMKELTDALVEMQAAYNGQIERIALGQ